MISAVPQRVLEPKYWLSAWVWHLQPPSLNTNPTRRHHFPCELCFPQKIIPDSQQYSTFIRHIHNCRISPQCHELSFLPVAAAEIVWTIVTDDSNTDGFTKCSDWSRQRWITGEWLLLKAFIKNNLYPISFFTAT